MNCNHRMAAVTVSLGVWLVACGEAPESQEDPNTLGKVTASSTESIPTASLSLWLRADLGIATNGALVTNWADQSSNHNDAQMSLASRQPSLINGALNGQPVIRFSGAQSLSLTRALAPSTFTVFVVGKNSNPAETFSMILGPGGSNVNNQLRWENGTQSLIVGIGNNLPIVTSTIGNTRIYHELAVRYDGSRLTVYRDGIIASTSSFTTSGPWNLNQIGASYSTYFMRGDVAEILFYASALPSSDMSSIDTYINGRYALGAGSTGSTGGTGGPCGFAGESRSVRSTCSGIGVCIGGTCAP